MAGVPSPEIKCYPRDPTQQNISVESVKLGEQQYLQRKSRSIATNTDRNILCTNCSKVNNLENKDSVVYSVNNSILPNLFNFASSSTFVNSSDLSKDDRSHVGAPSNLCDHCKNNRTNSARSGANYLPQSNNNPFAANYGCLAGFVPIPLNAAFPALCPVYIPIPAFASLPLTQFYPTIPTDIAQKKSVNIEKVELKKQTNKAMENGRKVGLFVNGGNCTYTTDSVSLTGTESEFVQVKRTQESNMVDSSINCDSLAIPGNKNYPDKLPICNNRNLDDGNKNENYVTKFENPCNGEELIKLKENLNDFSLPNKILPEDHTSRNAVNNSQPVENRNIHYIDESDSKFSVCSNNSDELYTDFDETQDADVSSLNDHLLSGESNQPAGNRQFSFGPPPQNEQAAMLMLSLLTRNTNLMSNGANGGRDLSSMLNQMSLGRGATKQPNNAVGQQQMSVANNATSAAADGNHLHHVLLTSNDSTVAQLNNSANVKNRRKKSDLNIHYSRD